MKMSMEITMNIDMDTARLATIVSIRISVSSVVIVFRNYVIVVMTTTVTIMDLGGLGGSEIGE